MRPRPPLVWSFAVLLVACGGGSGDTGESPESTGPDGSSSSGAATTTSADTSGSTTGDAPPPSRWIVTADFLAQTLSLVDYDALVAGERDPAALVVDTIDLSMYPPGALEVEIAPDGHTALVSISPGFYDSIVGQTLGFGELVLDGTFLVIDLDTREIVAEPATAHVPMGFAFLPDGSRAYSANFGHTDAPGSTVSVIDMTTFEVLEDIEVGPLPEQIAIDEAGALGIFNVDGTDSVRVFETSDPAGTMSEPLVVSDDPSGVAFVSGTSLAVVANSLAPSSWTVVDVSDPAMPVIRDEAPPPGGFPYGVTAIPGTSDVLVTIANDATTYVRITTGPNPSEIVWELNAEERSFPLGIAVDVASGLALSGATGGDALLVMALDGSSLESIPWVAPGPAYVAIGAAR
jgi:YVTN family beta-propeller protein